MKIKESTLEMTCGGCPSQWEARTTEDLPVYIRVRHGLLYVEIDGKRVLEGYPDQVDGVMSTVKMIDYVEWNSNILFV